MAGPEGRAPGPDRTATDRSDADRRSADVRSAHRRGIGHRIGRRWWMAGLAIAALVVIVLAPLASNALGHGLRDAFHPRTTR